MAVLERPQLAQQSRRANQGRLFVTGPPGCGKTSLTRSLARRYGLASADSSELMATGDVNETERQATGRLGSDEKATNGVLAFASGLEDGQGYIIAGYPRTEGQKDSPAVCAGAILIFLDVPEEEAKRRSDARTDRNDTDRWPTRISEYKEKTLPMIEVAELDPHLIFIKVPGYWRSAQSREHSEELTYQAAVAQLDRHLHPVIRDI